MVKENKESLMRWLNSCNTDTPNPNPAEMWGFFMHKFCHSACADQSNNERPKFVLQATQNLPSGLCADPQEKKF